MKPLEDMTLEELWQLFPILLREYNPAYPAWFQEEATKISACLGTRVHRISHIGSTAVPGLLSKPTVDILLETDDPAGAVPLLEADGWGLMHQEPDRFSMNKGYTPAGFAEKVFHLHLRLPGDWDELYFREYLRAHPEAREAYAALKRSLLPHYTHDRDGYTAAKTAFVRQCTEQARQEQEKKNREL